MIEPARRAIAVKVADIDLVAQTRRIEQPVQLPLVLIVLPALLVALKDEAPVMAE